MFIILACRDDGVLIFPNVLNDGKIVNFKPVEEINGFFSSHEENSKDTLKQKKKRKRKRNVLKQDKWKA